jgi:hypothetical protein
VLCVCAAISVGELNKWIGVAARLDIDHRIICKGTQAETAKYFRDNPTAVFRNVETVEMLNAKVNLITVRRLV